MLAFGFGPVRNAFNPPGVTRGFGWLGDLLAAPAARWDASWYLVIAHYGYRPDLGSFTSSRTAFFPLYPLGLRAIAWSACRRCSPACCCRCGALALALYGIHRLTTLELAPAPRSRRSPPASGREVARLAVLITAFAPMAFYLLGGLLESLYLALSVGLFWCARHGRWARSGLLGALAGATRSAGVVLRAAGADPLPVRPARGPARRTSPCGAVAAAPRYRLRARRPVAGAGAGRASACTWPTSALAGGDALMPFHAQDVWGRHFAGPYLGVWDGIRAAFEGARQLLSFQRHHVYFPSAGGSPFVDAGHNLMLLAFLLAAVPAVVGCCAGCRSPTAST